MMFNTLMPNHFPTERPATESKVVENDFSQWDDTLVSISVTCALCEGKVPLVEFAEHRDSKCWYSKLAREVDDLYANENMNSDEEFLNTESKEISAAEAVDVIDLNQSTANMNYINEEHFGELPVSFRALCKRYTSYRSQSSLSLTSTANKIFYYSTTIIPAASPSYTGAATTNNTNLITYLRYAYIGVRGGIKRRIGLTGGDSLNTLTPLKVSLMGPEFTAANFCTTTADVTNYVSSLNGSVTFIPTTNGGVEFEAPFYTNNLFGIAFSDDPFPVSNTNVDDLAVRNFKVTKYVNLTDPSNTYVIDDIAAGEDFSYLRFQGAPPYQI